MLNGITHFPHNCRVTNQPMIPAIGTAVCAPTIIESSGTETIAEPNPVKPWVKPAKAMIIETNIMVVSILFPVTELNKFIATISLTNLITITFVTLCCFYVYLLSLCDIYLKWRCCMSYNEIIVQTSYIWGYLNNKAMNKT